MLREFELLEATSLYCNGHAIEGGEDKEKLMSVAKNFTKDDIASTIELAESTAYGDDENVTNTLKKLYKARKK